jgi:hypothetical protein
MRLLELFRTSTPIQPLHQDGDHWMATWNDGDEQFIISFRPTDYPNTYTFYFAPNLAPDERPTVLLAHRLLKAQEVSKRHLRTSGRLRTVLHRDGETRRVGHQSI